MEVNDVRSMGLKHIFQISSRFPPNTHHIHGFSYCHETSEDDITRYMCKAQEEQADMIMILNYGVDWYIPNTKGA